MMFLHKILKHNLQTNRHDIICIIEMLQQLPAVENNIKIAFLWQRLAIAFYSVNQYPYGYRV